jgi:hypothetical protein
MKTIKKVRKIKKLTVTFMSDPGHGWFKIERKILRSLDSFYKISSYSYERGTSVFLEEDQDAEIIFLELKRRGVDVRIKIAKQSNKLSKIRSYNRFRLSDQEVINIVKNPPPTHLKTIFEKVQTEVGNLG